MSNLNNQSIHCSAEPNFVAQEGLIVKEQLKNLRNEILEKAVKINKLAEAINSKIEEKHEFFNGLDLKKCLQGTINYIFLLEKVCAALTSESEKLEEYSNRIKEDPLNKEVLAETIEKIATSRRTLKNVKKDIQISFSRYEHFFGIQKIKN